MNQNQPLPDCRTIKTKPPFRRLRAYAFDPSLSIQLDTSVINDVVYNIEWEELQPGPVGEYVEVIDVDPSCGCFYRPVNLDDHFVLAQDGLDPDEGNPQFHQQMVYAVAMTTIKNFEIALGRKVLWSPYRDPRGKARRYIGKLRLYPHALREANAYYSPLKKSILFGYFNATPDQPDLHMPSGTVFTCLNHDIIAHEITHALLDGMHRRYVEATHHDSLAFHEAFADMVALFQHFSFPSVLKQQIAKTRGDLASQNLLGQLAQEFGKAIGHYGSLRDAIGKVNKEKKWEPLQPDPKEYQRRKEPHERGAILVATIFDAFLNIYKHRVADLLRLSSGGTGLISGELHPDLINRLAIEAGKSAGHILRMCVRALDYCPPVDINFGDYLRAIITADVDLVEDDVFDYRVALIEAFQKRGIYPDNVKNMSVDSLLCKAEYNGTFENKFMSLIEFFKSFKEKISYINDREEIYDVTLLFIAGGTYKSICQKYNRLPGNNDDRYIQGLHERIMNIVRDPDPTLVSQFEELTGLALQKDHIDCRGIDRSSNPKYRGYPKFEVHNLKLASRVGPRGKIINQIVVTLTQRRGVVVGYDNGVKRVRGYFSPDRPELGWHEVLANGQVLDHYRPQKGEGMLGPDADIVLPDDWIVFRGGSTLIFDLNYALSRDNIKLKYIIKKDIREVTRMLRQHEIQFEQENYSLNATYFGKPQGNLEAEPFAIIHKVI